MIGLAAAYPPLGKKGGILRTGNYHVIDLSDPVEYSIKYGVVALIFFISGLSLKTSVLKEALVQWKVHAIIQVLSLGLFPVTGFGVGKFLTAVGYNLELADGYAFYRY